MLLDIEGTTTPIEFVHNVLFPYARARVRDYLTQYARDPDVQAELSSLKSEHAAESARERPPAWHEDDTLGSAIAYIYWLMDRDRKSTTLKSLQGRIWEAGYRTGELSGKGEVYPDVAPTMRRWRSEGKDIAIFSSGSVQAQRNLFANTTAGDLSSLINGYFDTTTGPKREAQSYRRIAIALLRPPEEILFISDVTAELDAAAAAGLRTAHCVRDAATAPVQSSLRHARIHSFSELA